MKLFLIILSILMKKYILLVTILFVLTSCTQWELELRTDKVTTVTPWCDMYVTYLYCNTSKYDICPNTRQKPIYNTICENKVTTETSHTENCWKNCINTIQDKTETIKK